MSAPVYIADDNPQNSALLQEALQTGGYAHEATRDISALVNALQEHQGGTVLLGASFSGMDALNVIPVLKQMAKKACVILVAEAVSVAYERQAREQGIFYHALPPQTSDDVKELQLVLSSAAAKQQQAQPRLWQRLSQAVVGSRA